MIQKKQNIRYILIIFFLCEEIFDDSHPRWNFDDAEDDDDEDADDEDAVSDLCRFDEKKSDNDLLPFDEHDV